MWGHRSSALSLPSQPRIVEFGWPNALTQEAKMAVVINIML